ncbi:hypothetical protein VPH35_035032 [Triticum aestivum]|uniref:PGG domain-containing protein n=4 Tax=Aegilops tauschii subsp. strangulata TaxID=200361 RepID=A0A453APW7_AEGTS
MYDPKYTNFWLVWASFLPSRPASVQIRVRVPAGRSCVPLRRHPCRGLHVRSVAGSPGMEPAEKVEQCAPSWLKELFEHPEKGGEEAADVERTLEKRQKLLLLLEILAASLTYQAGMSLPGGFWQESKLGHVAGDPVLNDNYPRRYVAFFYRNATAFVASLGVIMLLVNRKLLATGIRSRALRVCVILDLVGLMGAFAAGSCRKVSTSIYVLVLTFAVLLCIALQVTLVLSETA